MTLCWVSACMILRITESRHYRSWENRVLDETETDLESVRRLLVLLVFSTLRCSYY